MYSHILSPVDGSAASESGMREAIGLAKEQHAALRFLHVLELHPPPSGYGGGLVAGNAGELLRVRGAEILAAARDAARKQGVSAEAVMTESAEGRIAELVLHEAARWPADLIVIGTHGCRGASELFLGSDAEAIARLARASVLLVRAAPGLSTSVSPPV